MLFIKISTDQALAGIPYDRECLSKRLAVDPLPPGLFSGAKPGKSRMAAIQQIEGPRWTATKLLYGRPGDHPLVLPVLLG